MRKIALFLLGKAFVCKYIDKKHEYHYKSTYVTNRTKIHIICCDDCGSIKKIVV